MTRIFVRIHPVADSEATVTCTRKLASSIIARSVPPMKLTAVFEKVPEGYIGFVEELPGANCQATTLEEARSDLAEAVELVLEANRFLSEESLRGREVTRETIVVSAN
jgi:predicted RNase H-like HicB family nuclease